MLDQNFIQKRFLELQGEICAALEQADGTGRFQEDQWERPGGGGGRSKVMENGAVIEKGGVNFSAVSGQLPESVMKALQVSDDHFFATGISIVMHPQNPFVPIIHMNIRYFELNNGTYWFGGGIDLTPHYINSEQAQFFHQQLKQVCDRYNPSFYAKFKTWADDYFYIPHRQEARGIGGIFFDRLDEASSGLSKEKLFEFVYAVGQTFAPTYTKLMEINKNQAFTDEHRQWQYLRRGRYVEFNLVYDKGTKFGLETNGRIESILMSLPTTAQWIYNFTPKTGSEEEKTLNLLKKGIKWGF